MNVKKLTVALALMTLLTSAAQAVDVARVNGKSITDREAQAALGGMNQAQRKRILSDEGAKREILSNLVEQEILTQEAERQKLDQDASFREAMSQFRRQYLSQRLLDQYLSARMTQDAVRSFYSMNKRKFTTDQVEIAHILVNDEKSAMDVLRMAKAPNADFQALAEKFSKDPSAKNNRGYIGPIGWDAPFVEDFKEVAFTTPRGQIGGPVRTSFGYHLVKVLNRKTGQTKSLDEVELLVREGLRKSLVLDYVSKLRKSAQVVTNPKGFQSL